MINVAISSRVHNALISGVTPVFSWVYTLIGNVDSLGPLIKILITTSSIDMANASSEPEITAGIIRGNVISKTHVRVLTPDLWQLPPEKDPFPPVCLNLHQNIGYTEHRMSDE